MADGVKGLSKEFIIPIACDRIVFIVGPLILFTIRYLRWTLYPVRFPFLIIPSRGVLLLCILRLRVFGVLRCGWIRGSQYGVLGGMRACAQRISYEVVYNTIFMLVGFIISRVELHDIAYWRGVSSRCLIEETGVWIVVVLAELNRTPFDFVEGESELVSGYMVEYGGVGFILIVLSEYGALVFRGVLTRIMFFSSGSPIRQISSLTVSVTAAAITVLFILLRGCLPRYRYDKLMELCWEGLLPYVTVVGISYIALCG